MEIYHKSQSFSFYGADDNPARLLIKLFGGSVSCGFPSPSEDVIESQIDLNKYLISNPVSTFIVRAHGKSMEGARIFDNSLLIVDRAKTISYQSVCLCILEGDFTVKRVRKTGSNIYLIPENPDFKEIKVTPEMDFEIWGVVVKVINDPQ